MVGAVVEEGRLLHPVLLRHLVVVEEAAGAPAHPLGLVLDPLAHAAWLDHLRPVPDIRRSASVWSTGLRRLCGINLCPCALLAAYCVFYCFVYKVKGHLGSKVECTIKSFARGILWQCGVHFSAPQQSPLSLFKPDEEYYYWHCDEVGTVQAADSRSHSLDVTHDAGLLAWCWSAAPPPPPRHVSCLRHSRTHCHTPGPVL